MAIFKNVASQKIAVYAHNTAADTPKTGDAANITAQISLNGAATAATNDTNPTELDATDAPGIYLFDMTQAETNTDLIILSAVSATGDISIEPVLIYTLPTYANTQVAQTGDSYARLGAPAGASVSADIAVIDGNVDAVLVDTAEIGTAGAGLTNIDLPDQTMNIIGNITGNLSGSVGSVTGAVGSVTGNVGGIAGTITTLDALDTAQDLEHATTQALVGNLSTGSGGISTTATTFVKSGAEPETNTYTATGQLDGTYHIVEDVGGATDAYYQFNVGPNGVPISFEWTGYAQGNNDTYAIYAYNYGGTAYEQIGSITGTVGTTVQTVQFSMTTAHVGTGANDGLVRFRFLSADGTAIGTDYLLCTYTAIDTALGYEGGAVWVDEAAGTSTGTTPGVDGLVTNRSDDFDNAQTIATALGYTAIYVTNGNSITLTGAITNFTVGIPGGNWTLALGGQDVSNCDINDATVSGVAAGSDTHYHDCTFNNTTIRPGSFLYNPTWTGTITIGAAGDYNIIYPHSGVAGSGSPVLDMASVVGATTLSIRGHKGGLTVNNLTSDHTLTIGGDELGTVTLNGADATVEIRGVYKALVNNLTGSPTVNVGGAILGADVAAILVDTAEIGVAGAGLTEAGGTGDHLTAIDLPNQTMDIVGNITGNLSGSVGSVTGNVGGVAGTITTLDALDTAQDAQHASTQADIAALNDLSAAAVNAEVDTALSDYDPPTRTELTTDTNSILAKVLSYFQLLLRKDAAIATDNAAELTAINADGGSGAGAFDNTTESTEAIRDRGDSAWITGGGGSAPTVEQIRTEIDSNSTQLAAIVADTNELQTDWANGGRLDLILDELTTQGDTNESKLDIIDGVADAVLVDTGTTIPAQISALQDLSAADILTTQLTESYAADGTAPTLAQAIFLIQQSLGDFSISGTTITVKKLDGSTTAATYTLDDGTSPTSRTRTS